MQKTIQLIGSMLIMIFLSNCATDEMPENFDYGNVNGNIYTNDFFECTIHLPANWIVQSKEQLEHLANIGKELVVGDDEKLKSAVNASEVNTANLLAVFQYELGSAVEYNPNIMILAENVSKVPGIKTGSDYLFQSRRFLKQSQFQYDYLSEDFEKEMINGVEFYKMDAMMSFMGLEVNQMYYSTISKGFSFNVIVSFINDDQRKKLQESLGTIQFKK